VTVKLYTPLYAVDGGVPVDDAAVEVKPAGPLQLYDGEPVPLTPIALKVDAVPTQKKLGDMLIEEMVGTGFTETIDVVLIVLVHPAPG
jgi:hypothetical protein